MRIFTSDFNLLKEPDENKEVDKIYALPVVVGE